MAPTKMPPRQDTITNTVLKPAATDRRCIPTRIPVDKIPADTIAKSAKRKTASKAVPSSTAANEIAIKAMANPSRNGVKSSSCCAVAAPFACARQLTRHNKNTKQKNHDRFIGGGLGCIKNNKLS